MFLVCRHGIAWCACRCKWDSVGSLGTERLRFYCGEKRDYSERERGECDVRASNFVA